MNDLLPFAHSIKKFSKHYFFTALVDFRVPFWINFLSSSELLASETQWNKTPCSLRLVFFVHWKISKHVWDLIFLNNNLIHNSSVIVINSIETRFSRNVFEVTSWTHSMCLIGSKPNSTLHAACLLNIT